MDHGPFWLLNISPDFVSVSYVAFDERYHIQAIGPEKPFDPDPDNFTEAVDASLSAAAETARVSSDNEPNMVALVLPPEWVGIDGKITPEKLKLFEVMFRSLKLNPLGFISFDEALSEAANLSEGFPASFVLTTFYETVMQVSLVYLGKVTSRVARQRSATFSASELEAALLELNSASTLPPEIIVCGNYTDQIINNIRNYPWIGRKDVETFLHLPEIKTYDLLTVTNYYLQAVTSQFDVDHIPTPSESPAPSTLTAPEETELVEAVTDSSTELEEISAAEMGFAPVDSLPQATPQAEPVLPPVAETPEPTIEPVSKSKIKIKISLPRLNIKLKRPALPQFSPRLLLFLLAFAPACLLIPFFFSRATIDLYLTPYTFKKDLQVVFDPTATAVDIKNSVFPITADSKETKSSATVPTTGEKTVGERSTGEVTIFNKLDKSLSLPKGTILSDSANHKFELETAVQIASSSSNLAQGVITLGQTKAMVKAGDIGPEYNLSPETVLHFKDLPDSNAVARVNNSFAGGSRRQIQAVSQNDKTAVDTKLTATINSGNGSTSTSSAEVIANLTQTKKGRVEYSREVGEEADSLTATVVSTTTTYRLTDPQKQMIIAALFGSEPDFKLISPRYDQFTLEIAAAKNSTDLPKGQATVTVKYLPLVDKSKLSKSISGKTKKTAISLIKKSYPRVYNYQIKTNFNFISLINPLPFRPENITINLK